MTHLTSSVSATRVTDQRTAVRLTEWVHDFSRSESTTWRWWTKRESNRPTATTPHWSCTAVSTAYRRGRRLRPANRFVRRSHNDPRRRSGQDVEATAVPLRKQQGAGHRSSRCASAISPSRSGRPTCHRPPTHISAGCACVRNVRRRWRCLPWRQRMRVLRASWSARGAAD